MSDYIYWVDFYFAHAGETDTGVAQSTVHIIFDKWYVALALLVLILLIVEYVVRIVSHGSKTAVYNSILFTLLVIGIGTYSRSSVLSVVSLGGGFAMAMFQVFFSLRTSDQGEKGSRR